MMNMLNPTDKIVRVSIRLLSALEGNFGRMESALRFVVTAWGEGLRTVSAGRSPRWGIT